MSKRPSAMRIGSRTYILLLIFAAVGLSLLVLLLGASVTVSPPSPAIVINNNNNNNNPATTKATSSGSGGSSSPSGNLRSSTSTTTSTPPLPRAGSGKPRIAYAITVTKDGPFVDGAVVLGYAARKVHDPARGYPGTYEADLVAFVTPGVTSSRAVLAAHGWRVLEKTLPVPLEEIENKKYVDKMRESGCCGADEFIKLHAYTLTEYHRVVHLDMDSIVYKNMDELYGLANAGLIYTGDYGMKGNSPAPPVQGGFLVVKPSLERYSELCAIIRRGDFGPAGWEGSHIGNFWGGQTIQGILAYFYHSVHPEEGVEANRCVYNCMVDNPYRGQTKVCLNGAPTCEDCRLQVIENVSSAHFTICQKPWTCTKHDNPRNKVLCEQLHAQWFRLRDEYERQSGIDLSYRAQNSRFADSLGMCSGYGDKKYLPIPEPK